MDIRAYERITKGTVTEEEQDEEIDINPMNGNRWQIQCKRYAELGPKKIKEIIEEDIDVTDVPYGYILAAPCVFSKKAYDAFRTVLAGKEVLEFYLWGRAELEMMLYQPKNDRILFTFFGISLASKRRTKTAEIKLSVANKNKLFRILGSDQMIYRQILIRDIQDTHYPDQKAYADFQVRPRWTQYEAIRYSVHGLFFLVHEYFAFWDKRAKTWDYSTSYDFVGLEDKTNPEADDPNYYRQPDKELTAFWESLSFQNQAKYKMYGLLRFEDMLLIDDKGDYLYECPQIYADFKQGSGPFQRFLQILEQEGSETQMGEDEYRRVAIFPDQFPALPSGVVHREKEMVLDPVSLRAFDLPGQGFHTIYYAGDTYDFLQVRDTIAVQNAGKGGYLNAIKITFIDKRSVGDIIEMAPHRQYTQQTIDRQLGRSADSAEVITVLEFKMASMEADQEGE